jgi:hypothetical protein
MAKIIFFNAAPNYDYLINSYPKASILKLVVDRFQVDSAMILQNDGWLQVNVNMEKAVVEKRTKEKIEEYKNDNFITFKKSKNRILYLEKTIQYLKNYGSVFLVRLPVESRMEEMETQLMPEFDSIMGELSEINQIPYLNYMPSSKSYTFTDGNHLYKTSGKKISKQIAKDIHTLIAN